jgi:hypothetical protein
MQAEVPPCFNIKVFMIWSRSSVDTPGCMYSPIISSVCAVSLAAFRIPMICSGVFISIFDILILLIYHIISRGFDPSAGPTIQSHSSISTTRAARPYQSLRCLWSIDVEHFPLDLTSSMAASIILGSSSKLPSHQAAAPSQFPRSHSIIE